MNYIVMSNKDFIQFVSLPEAGDGPVQPLVAQLRGDVFFVSKLLTAVEKVTARMNEIEQQYHYCSHARTTFDEGASYFVPGRTPIVLVYQRGHLTIYANGQVIADSIVNTEKFKRVLYDFVGSN